MADTATNEVKVPASPSGPLVSPLTIDRNSVKKPLKVFVGKRGAWDGKTYQAFQLTAGTLLEDIKFLGEDNVVNALNVICRRYGQDFVEDATDEQGIFSIDKFIDCWANLRLTALKLSELNEQYQIAVGEYKDFTSGELIDASDALAAAAETGDVDKIKVARDRMQAAKARVSQLGTTIAALKKDFDERKARRSKEAQEETTHPE